MINSSAHHLSDGTYANTSGVAYESSFNKLLKWSWERRSKNLETFEFEVEVPNYKEIYENENIVTTWIGHETFLYQNKDINVPHLTPYKTQYNIKEQEKKLPEQT